MQGVVLDELGRWKASIELLVGHIPTFGNFGKPDIEKTFARAPLSAV